MIDLDQLFVPQPGADTITFPGLAEVGFGTVTHAEVYGISADGERLTYAFVEFDQPGINRSPPFTFRVDGYDGPEAYPIEDQRPGHRIEMAHEGQYPGGLP